MKTSAQTRISLLTTASLLITLLVAGACSQGANNSAGAEAAVLHGLLQPEQGTELGVQKAGFVNLIHNGSFEEDAGSPPAGWSMLSPGALDARWGSTSPDGNRFSTFTSLTTSLSGRQARSTCFTLDPSKELRVTGYFRSKNSPQRVRAGFKVLYFADADCATAASRTYHSQNSYSPDARNEWVHNVWTRSAAVMPQDARSAYIVIRAKYVSGVGSNTDKVDFDDIRVDNGQAGGIGGDLRIGSFNIQILANTKMSRPAVVDVLVNTALRYDAMFIQELRNMPDSSDNTGPVIRDFFARVNAASNNAYSMAISTRVGDSSAEQYVVFYRHEKLTLVSHSVYADTSDAFLREPHLVTFSAAGTTFTVANIHVQPSAAVSEIAALTAVADSLSGSRTLILGDLNSDCTYFNESTDWSGVDLIARGWTNLIDDSKDTTVFTTTNCTYDRLLTSPALAAHVVSGQTRVFRFDDQSQGGYSMSAIQTEGCNTGYLSCSASSEDAAKKVSDHYPVEAVLRFQ